MKAEQQQRDLSHFVRSTLGCGCPDELLRAIHLDRDHLLAGTAISCHRLDVGGRLLVLLLGEPPAGLAIAQVVRDALVAGLAERDRLAFNRLRLVLVADDPAATEAEAVQAFAACPRGDERVHLHVLGSGDLPPALA